MDITGSVTPPDESCEDLVVETTGTFSPPAGVIDCPDPYCGRLISPLRVAAKQKDAKEILARAAVARYRDRHQRADESRAEFVGHPGRALRSRRHGPIRLRLLSRARPGRGGSQRTGEVEAGRGLPHASGRRRRPERRDQGDTGARLQGGLGAPRTGQPPQRGARRSGLDRCHRRGRPAGPAGERRVGALSAVRPDRAGRPTPVTPVTTRFVVASRQFQDEYPVKLKEVPPQTPTSAGRPRILRSARSRPSPETSFSSSTATARRPKRRCRWSGRSSSRRRTEDGR